MPGSCGSARATAPELALVLTDWVEAHRGSRILQRAIMSAAAWPGGADQFTLTVAPVTAALTLVPSHVTAAFAIYPHGGSIGGIAHASYILKNSIAYFGGTLTITRGTGAYRGASGTNVGFSGWIDRQNFSMSIKVHGWVVL